MDSANQPADMTLHQERLISGGDMVTVPADLISQQAILRSEVGTAMTDLALSREITGREQVGNPIHMRGKRTTVALADGIRSDPCPFTAIIHFVLYKETRRKLMYKFVYICHK